MTQENETKQPWTMERIHTEISDARTKVFVVAKVLETGKLKPEEEPEWALVILPLLKDIAEHAAAIQELMQIE